MIARSGDDRLLNASPLAYERGVQLPLGECPKDGWLRLFIEGQRFDIPKLPEENRKYRKHVIKQGDESEGFREYMKWACSRPCPESLVLWLNTFGYTFRVQKIVRGREVQILGKGSVVPFVTWPSQDGALARMHSAITTPHPLVVDKSRKQGATWLIGSAIHWFWQFTTMFQAMEISRREAEVDDGRDNNEATTFFKHMLLHSWQPEWLQPMVRRTKLHIENLDNGAAIVGASTTGEQGRSGRKHVVMVDEASLVMELRDLWVSLSQTTNCAIVNGTPFGGGFFTELVEDDVVPKLELMWWDHPEMGEGRYVKTDVETGDRVISSPYRDIREEEAQTPMEIAQELDAEHHAGALVPFATKMLRRCEAQHSMSPTWRGELACEVGYDPMLALQQDRRKLWSMTENPSGKWSMWLDLEGDRPPQQWTYAMGIDVAIGNGASNSVISVIRVDDGEQVAEYVDSNIQPGELAYVAAAAGRWFGGGSYDCAFLNFELNGPGLQFWDKLKQINYAWLFRHIRPGHIVEKEGQQMGWWSGDQGREKSRIIGLLASRMHADDVTLRSKRFYVEARTFIFYPSGSCGPNRLLEESASARKTHGDRVMAMAIASLAADQCHAQPAPKRKPPPDSAAARLAHIEERARNQEVYDPARYLD